MTATTSTFADRLAVGVAHEHYVADELRARGWAADQWGQGLLCPRNRNALSRTDSLFRHEPDIIASRGDDDLVMLDCKASMSPGTGRRTVSRAALHAAFAFTAERHLPLYFVFDDLTVLAPHELLRPGWPSPFASRVAYYRIPDGLVTPFDAVFGRPTGRNPPPVRVAVAA